MTREIVRPGFKAFVFEPEAPQQCDLCGIVAELRPYGPNGECICFECGMKNRAATERAFERRMERFEEASHE